MGCHEKQLTELKEDSVCYKMEHTDADWNKYSMQFYYLDTIIYSYRVFSIPVLAKLASFVLLLHVKHKLRLSKDEYAK